MSVSELSEIRAKLLVLTRGLPKTLPRQRPKDPSISHAPRRPHSLSDEDFRQAVSNALRYFPKEQHAILAPEFAEELREDGHIHMRRFVPTEYEMKAYPIDVYPAKCKHAAVVMLMIMNNLDRRVAQFPEELVTYGGNGSVFSNWAQFHLTMKYLSELTDHQTLHMYSGHPAGLFPSTPSTPRLVITNGMVIPNYSKREDYNKMYAMGVSIYGQMTAGSYCYIGPQGIVHGTTLTLLNAGRKYLGLDNLFKSGSVYVSSGLGGMSGAQSKAGAICGAISVIAEVDYIAVKKRHDQGWILEIAADLDDCVQRIKNAKRAKATTSIAYHGNIVDLWERLAEEDELLVELGSDQTSCHNVFGGGYYPAQLSFEEGQRMLAENPARFKELVEESLRRQVAAINKLVQRGMKFWDYGNCFLLEASRAKADIMAADNIKFRYPSYVEEFMGDIFSLGFGPFRWVCTSGLESDLKRTDEIAGEVIERLRSSAPPRVKFQYNDNLLWIQQAFQNRLVVGSQARILYSGAEGRMETAVAFNNAIKSGEIKGPIVLSRDHHDVSGTDSPFRETADIRDGSMFCADMAIQNVIGDSFRGATWVAIHNGGGVGWGEVINGGFGLVLDGTKEAEEKARQMLYWDVNNGIVRRAWAGNDNANFQLRMELKKNKLLNVTIANPVDEKILAKL